MITAIFNNEQKDMEYLNKGKFRICYLSFCKLSCDNKIEANYKFADVSSQNGA